jgi:hypothetical protein
MNPAATPSKTVINLPKRAMFGPAALMPRKRTAYYGAVKTPRGIKAPICRKTQMTTFIECA